MLSLKIALASGVPGGGSTHRPRATPRTRSRRWRRCDRGDPRPTRAPGPAGCGPAVGGSRADRRAGRSPSARVGERAVGLLGVDTDRRQRRAAAGAGSARAVAVAGREVGHRPRAARRSRSDRPRSARHAEGGRDAEAGDHGRSCCVGSMRRSCSCRGVPNRTPDRARASPHAGDGGATQSGVSFGTEPRLQCSGGGQSPVGRPISHSNPAGSVTRPISQPCPASRAA